MKFTQEQLDMRMSDEDFLKEVFHAGQNGDTSIFKRISTREKNKRALEEAEKDYDGSWDYYRVFNRIYGDLTLLSGRKALNVLQKADIKGSKTIGENVHYITYECLVSLLGNWYTIIFKEPRNSRVSSFVAAGIDGKFLTRVNVEVVTTEVVTTRVDVKYVY